MKCGEQDCVGVNSMPPAVTCVFCGCDKKRTKLVSCLHSLCLPCLGPHIQDDGSIICPYCKASTPLQQIGCSAVSCLPDSYSKRDVCSEGQSSLKLCEECMDAEAAVSCCKTCNSHLCADHSKLHKKSRATHGHEVLVLNEVSTEGATASTAEQIHKCPLHSASVLYPMSETVMSVLH